MKRLKTYNMRGKNDLSILDDKQNKTLCFQVKSDFCIAPMNKRLVKELIKDLEDWLEVTKKEEAE